MSDALFPREIGGYGLYASIIPLGASLRDLRLDGFDFPLVLGLHPEDQKANPQFYMGAVIGRHANRIGFGRASVDGEALALALNAPPHHSAGGTVGFSRRAWQVAHHDATELSLSLISPDGEEGYPGEVRVTATYKIAPGPVLSLAFSAHADRNTILNMCHHPYFNLDGSETADNHVLEIAADTYLPCDETVLPSAGPTPVTGSAFDFTTPRTLGDISGQNYNNTFCLSDAPANPLRFAARLTGTTGLSMDVWTTQSGLHLYNGYKLVDCPCGHDGRSYHPRSGVCLEAQNWPDAPNHPDFPSSLLKPGQRYEQVTEYRFSRPTKPVLELFSVSRKH